MLRWVVMLVATAVAGPAQADMAVGEPARLGTYLPEIADELPRDEAERLVDRYGLDPEWIDCAWDEADLDEGLPSDVEEV